jgi:hypothetical protein
MGDHLQCQAVEAGDVIGLLRRALGADAIPEVFTTVRQQTEREREIAGMFRNGEVGKAIAAKRHDGTAELVEGGYHDAVRRVAALYREQREAAPDMTVTISAPTNADARRVSQAVREVRRQMGEVGGDQATVTASDGRGEDYALALAPGDRVRLYKRIGIRDQGGRMAGSLGDNGSILTVEAVEPGKGLRLRAESGRVAFVPWQDLRHKGSSRVALTYGDCLTIDTSQGMTSDIHIHALPGGSSAVSGFKNYVAQTRHRVRSYMVASMGAELRGAIASRPLGLPEPKGVAAQDEAWSNVIRNLSRTSPKESALAMLSALTSGRRRAAQALQAGLRAQEARMRNGVENALGRRLGQVRQVRAVEQALPAVAAAVEERTRAIEQAADFPELAAVLAEMKPKLQVAGLQVATRALTFSEALGGLLDDMQNVRAYREEAPTLEARALDVEARVSDRLESEAAVAEKMLYRQGAAVRAHAALSARST